MNTSAVKVGAERVAWYVALQLIAGAVALYSAHISPVYFYTHWGHIVFALYVPDAWLGCCARATGRTFNL